MPKILFTSALKKFYPSLKSQEIPAQTLPELISKVNEIYPGIQDYILEQDGSLRKHVNIFISGELIKDRIALKDGFKPDDEIYVFQALSGG